MHILTILGSFFSGVIGSMGFGSGTVLIILMTVFLSVEQKTAQGVKSPLSSFRVMPPSLLANQLALAMLRIRSRLSTVI